MITAFFSLDGQEVLRPDSRRTTVYVFTLFDTGSTRIGFPDFYAANLGVTDWNVMPMFGSTGWQ